MGITYSNFDDKTEKEKEAFLRIIGSLYNDALKYKP